MYGGGVGRGHLVSCNCVLVFSVGAFACWRQQPTTEGRWEKMCSSLFLFMYCL